jgi:hypothetical protein
MVRVDIKGLFKITAKGRVYWYAWRGGPRLSGEPGSPEFHASYQPTFPRWLGHAKGIYADLGFSPSYRRFGKPAVGALLGRLPKAGDNERIFHHLDTLLPLIGLTP